MFAGNIISVQSNPSDTVSQLRWSPNSKFLACSSWDKKVYIWNFTSGQPIPQIAHEYCSPVLDLSWCSGGDYMAFGGCDNKAMLWDLNANSVVQVAQHQAPVKVCRMVKVGPGNEVLCTGSWDKKIQYTDLRQRSSIAQVSLPDKVHCADFLNELGVVFTLNKYYIFNMNNPSTFQTQVNSSCKSQLRSVGIFSQCNGFACGTVEGRAWIYYLKVPSVPYGKSDYSFKCHRDNENIYAVNVTVCSPTRDDLVVTGGSDGIVSFWDKNNRSKYYSLPKLKSPITSATISLDGNYLAYSEGYDWSRGVEGAGNNPVQIYINKIDIGK